MLFHLRIACLIASSTATVRDGSAPAAPVRDADLGIAGWTAGGFMVSNATRVSVWQISYIVYDQSRRYLRECSSVKGAWGLNCR